MPATTVAPEECCPRQCAGDLVVLPVGIVLSKDTNRSLTELEEAPRGRLATRRLRWCREQYGRESPSSDDPQAYGSSPALGSTPGPGRVSVRRNPFSSRHLPR